MYPEFNGAYFANGVLTSQEGLRDELLPF